MVFNIPFVIAKKYTHILIFRLTRMLNMLDDASGEGTLTNTWVWVYFLTGEFLIT